MQILQLSFSTILNESLQIGDRVYYVPTATTGSFTTSVGVGVTNVVQLGVVTNFNSLATGSTVDVLWDDSDNDGDTFPDIPAPLGNEYIMFDRDPVVNNTSLKGYYAEVKFVNNSKEKAELFSVNSEIFESSK